MRRLRVTLEFAIDMGKPERYGPKLPIEVCAEHVERRILKSVIDAARSVSNSDRSDPGAVGYSYTIDR